MRKSMKEAIGTTVQDMLESGFKSSFTKNELNTLGVKLDEVIISSSKIKEIRKKTNLSATTKYYFRKRCQQHFF